MGSVVPTMHVTLNEAELTGAPFRSIADWHVTFLLSWSSLHGNGWSQDVSTALLHETHRHRAAGIVPELLEKMPCTVAVRPGDDVHADTFDGRFP